MRVCVCVCVSESVYKFVHFYLSIYLLSSI